MNNIKEKAIIEVVKDAYINYGTYVNFNRCIPNVLDGLKPSYRKAIYATMKVCKDGLANVDSVLGEIVKYYSHGPQYIVPILCKLSKFGILRDDGANGAYFIYGDNVPHAASRYLETGVEPFYYKLFSKLINYVPFELSDKGHNEPLYIPTPIPLGLTFGYNAISCGSNTEIPPFTAKSLYDAMINNDPSKLVLSFGLELLQNKSNIKGIWDQGSGKLAYKYKTKIEDFNGVKSVFISGNPIYSNINWKIENPEFSFGSLDKLIERNAVEIIDLENGDNGIRNIVIKPKNDQVDIQELYDYVNNQVSFFKLIKLTVVAERNDKKVVTRIPLKTWLRTTYTNYISLLSKFKETNIKSYQDQIEVLTWWPVVAQIYIDNYSQHKEINDSEIASQLGISIDIVNKITSKPLNTLKNSDTSGQIANIKAKIEEMTKFDERKFTEEIINQIP